MKKNIRFAVTAVFTMALCGLIVIGGCAFIAHFAPYYGSDVERGLALLAVMFAGCRFSYAAPDRIYNWLGKDD